MAIVGLGTSDYGGHVVAALHGELDIMGAGHALPAGRRHTPAIAERPVRRRYPCRVHPPQQMTHQKKDEPPMSTAKKARTRGRARNPQLEASHG